MFPEGLGEFREHPLQTNLQCGMVHLPDFLKSYAKVSMTALGNKNVS